MISSNFSVENSSTPIPRISRGVANAVSDDIHKRVFYPRFVSDEGAKTNWRPVNREFWSRISRNSLLPYQEVNARDETTDRVSDKEILLQLPDDFISTHEHRAIRDTPVEKMWHYNLVMDESTDTVRWPKSIDLVCNRFWNTKVEFLNARELTFPYSIVGINTVDESLPPSTDSLINAQVETQLDRLFSAAHEEQFETGVDSRFSKGLEQLYVHAPSAVLKSLIDRLVGRQASPQVLAEMLEWVSRQEQASRNDIVKLLSIGLCNASPLVRDAAALSLAYFDGNTAIPYLNQAIQKENVPELQMDLRALVHSLET